MKTAKVGIRIIQLGIILWIIQNCIFGWNAHPLSDAEKTADWYCNVIISVGIFLYLLPLHKLYQHLLKKMDDE